MIKIPLLFCVFVFYFNLNLFAQGKEDYTWLFGYGPNVPEQFFGGSALDFHADPPQVSFFKIPLDLEATTMMSGPDGALLFYSNGCKVMNRLHRQMPNGGKINEGPAAVSYCKYGGYPAGNGIMAIPDPGNHHLYYLFHVRVIGSRYVELRYSKADMRLDNGLGDVVEHNQLMLRDTFTDMLTAVRHGNGRDWWVVVHKHKGNKIFLFLVDTAGVHGPFSQAIGHNWSDWG